MALCFIEPAEAIQVVLDSVGREAREYLLSEVTQAWVEQLPDNQLEPVYATAVAQLDGEDLAMLAAWHASLEIGTPVASREFLLGTFSELGEYRREALRLAAGFSSDSWRCTIGPEALSVVLPSLEVESVYRLASVAVAVYVKDRLGSTN